MVGVFIRISLLGTDHVVIDGLTDFSAGEKRLLLINSHDWTSCVEFAAAMTCQAPARDGFTVGHD